MTTPTRTVIGIDGDRFTLDGRPTCPGRSWRGYRIEGLLFNSRMANAIVDDENPAARGVWDYADGPWSAERNTAEFCAVLPAYRAHGLAAVAIKLQGGKPARLFVAPALADVGLLGRGEGSSPTTQHGSGR